MSGCTHDCSTCKEDCKDRKESFIVEPNKHSSIGRTIAIVSGKGGVGKSLVTSLLAVEASRKGKRVAIMDADITGPSIPQVFGVHERLEGDEEGISPAISGTGIQIVSMNLLLEEETDPIIWRGPMIAGMVKQFYTDVIYDKVDDLYIDLPPGTGDVPLTIFQSIKMDGIVIVLTPQDLVSMVVEKAVKMANMMNIPILGFVENMSYIVCDKCNNKVSLFGEGHIEELAKKYNIPVLAKIPLNPEIAKLCDAGKIEFIKETYFEKVKY